MTDKPVPTPPPPTPVPTPMPVDPRTGVEKALDAVRTAVETIRNAFDTKPVPTPMPTPTPPPVAPPQPTPMPTPEAGAGRGFVNPSPAVMPAPMPTPMPTPIPPPVTSPQPTPMPTPEAGAGRGFVNPSPVVLAPQTVAAPKPASFKYENTSAVVNGELTEPAQNAAKAKAGQLVENAVNLGATQGNAESLQLEAALKIGAGLKKKLHLSDAVDGAAAQMGLPKLPTSKAPDSP